MPETTTAAPVAESLFGVGLMAGYAPLPGVADEMMDASGAVRPHWRSFLNALNTLGQEEVDSRFDAQARRLRVTGASYRVYEGGGGAERAWPLSRLPLLMTAAEWRGVAEGVIQRARLHEALLADVYGPQTLVRDGALPAAVVAGSPEFLRPLVGVAPRGGKFLRIYAADLGRGPDGRWWVMADRAQAPSGAGYALENRLAMSGAFPEVFGAFDVERLAGFFQGFRESLAAQTAPGGVGVCMLTPGPLNETYFEHAYLARYLGFLLVEGEDITVRGDSAYVRTVAGLRRAEVFVRRLDADFADPLELNAASRLGAPGLVRAVRAGNVAMANALGAGLVESRALLGFMPALARHLLGEELLLPNVATWWCGQEREREAVIARFDELAIAPAFGGDGVRLGSEFAPAERDAAIEAIRRRGMDYVGQEAVSLSTMPVWDHERLSPRPFQIRVFAAATENGWVVMPGGFCRVAGGGRDPRAVSMQMGGRSADVWVLGDGPVAATSLLPPAGAVEVKRHVGALTARSADNLFWFGRYLERAEATLRLVRAGHLRFSARDRGERAVAQAISDMLAQWSAIPAEAPLLTRKIAAAALTDSRQIGSAAAAAAAARRAALGIRERFSVDVAGAVDDLAEALDPTVRPRAEPIERAERALRALAALAGLTHENMAQLTGWRFLEIGRRIERALATAKFVETLGLRLATPASLEALLELGDSAITYAQRYFVAAAQRPILDLLLLDDNNPRSCAFQIRALKDLVQHMPGEAADGDISPARRLAERLSAETIAAEASAVDLSFVARMTSELLELSNAISERYLVNRDRLAFSFRVDE